MRTLNRILAIGLTMFSFQAFSADILVRNATVHTAGSGGTLENTDVLVRDGKIHRIDAGRVML